MKVRLIKRDASSEKEEVKQHSEEASVINNVRSWVREFRSTKSADRQKMLDAVLASSRASR